MSQSIFSRFCFVVLIVWMALPLRGDDEPSAKSIGAAESILRPWKEAKDKFIKSQETAKSILVRMLDAAEEKARASGDLDKVTAIKEEKSLLNDNGTVPSLVKTVAYEKSMETAKSALRSTGQRVKTALVKQKFDGEAASLEQELADLLGTSSTKSQTDAVALPDGRTYWKEKVAGGKEFRLIKSGNWVETPRKPGRGYDLWKEVARTPEYVEIHDTNRKLGMRLKAGTADVNYNYTALQADGFGGYAGGGWVVDPPGVVYLSDLKEASLKVWHEDGKDGFGWGKNGDLNVGTKELIILESRMSPKGVFTHPPPKDFAMVKYDVGKLKKQLFRAKFGVADLRGKNPASALTFIVVGDGEKLFTSKPIQDCGVAHDCEVQIRKVKDLELRVQCAGDQSQAFAVWYEPRLSDD